MKCLKNFTRRHWSEKQCNKGFKPTGKSGDQNDSILRCQRIQLKILKKAGAGNEGLDADDSSDEDNDRDSANDDEDVDDEDPDEENIVDTEQVPPINRLPPSTPGALAQLDDSLLMPPNKKK